MFFENVSHFALMSRLCQRRIVSGVTMVVSSISALRPRVLPEWHGLKSLSDLPDPARIILEIAQIRPLNRH
jgi:hypothetical protein